MTRFKTITYNTFKLLTTADDDVDVEFIILNFKFSTKFLSIILSQSRGQ